MHAMEEFMKKIIHVIAIILIVALLFTFAACTSVEDIDSFYKTAKDSASYTVTMEFQIKVPVLSTPATLTVIQKAQANKTYTTMYLDPVTRSSLSLLGMVSSELEGLKGLAEVYESYAEEMESTIIFYTKTENEFGEVVWEADTVDKVDVSATKLSVSTVQGIKSLVERVLNKDLYYYDSKASAFLTIDNNPLVVYTIQENAVQIFGMGISLSNVKLVIEEGKVATITGDLIGAIGATSSTFDFSSLPTKATIKIHNINSTTVVIPAVA